MNDTLWVVSVLKQDGQLLFSSFLETKIEDKEKIKEFNLDGVTVIWRQDLDQPRIDFISQNKDRLDAFCKGISTHIFMLKQWDEVFSKKVKQEFHDKAVATGQWMSKQDFIANIKPEVDSFNWEKSNDESN